MKVCPLCHTPYDNDSIQNCTKDGTLLIVAQKLPENPPLPEAIHADPDADTADFDFEAIHSEYAHLKQEKKEEKNPSEVVIDNAVKPPAPPAPAPALPMPTPSRRSVSKTAWLSIGIIVLLLGLLTALYFWLSSSKPISVELRSYPNGAIVMLDGKSLGPSPVRAYVSPGKHEVVFSQKGYDPIQKILDVSKSGQITEKPLFQTALPKTNPPANQGK